MTTYWHGGPAGLPRGSFILPAEVTKSRSLSEYGAAGIHRRDRVYLTTSQAAAMLYAAGQRRGAIYQCEPIGTLEPDPDCNMPGLSWQCEKARIIRVLKVRPDHIAAARSILIGD